MVRPAKRQGNLSALMRAAKSARPAAAPHDLASSREEIADFCRYIGMRLDGELLGKNVAPIPKSLKLSPRMRQTLDRLLAGDSEKQIARELGVSPHTVHIYVKALYRGFDVCSRGELLARFVRVPLRSKSDEPSSPANSPGAKPKK